MVIGDFLSPNDKEKYITSILCVNSIFKLFIDWIQPPKEKYIVIIGENAKTESFGYVFINSIINANMPAAFQKLNYPISKNYYSFLNYDSFIACSTIKSFKKADIIKHLQSNLNIYKGRLQNSDFNSAIEFLQKAPTISKSTKRLYLPPYTP